MTKQVLSKLPSNVLLKVEEFKKKYTNVSYTGTQTQREMHILNETRIAMNFYVCGLRDAGLITEEERRVIFIYMSV